MFKLVVIAIVIACVSSAVVPKPPAAHSDSRNEHSSVKSTPLHPEHHSSTDNQKAAEVKADVNHESKAKSVSTHDNKENQHQHTVQKPEHHEEHHIAPKHHEVPVNVGHATKSGPVGHEVHKPEKAEDAKVKSAEHKH